MAFQGANPLSNLPSSFTIILSFSYEFLVMNFLPVKRVTYPHGLEQPFQLRRIFVNYWTFQIPCEVIEKKGGPRGGFTNLQDSEIVQNW